MPKCRGVLLSILCTALVGSCQAEDSAGLLPRILADKGIINPTELAGVEAASPENRVEMLASLLEEKGVLTQAEIAKLTRLREPTPRPMPARYQAHPSIQVPKPPPSGAEAAPPVTTEKKFPLTVYGTLLMNAFSNTSFTNLQDIPLFNSKQGSDPLGNDKSFGMTVRQSRFGMRYQGSQVAGARTNGQFEFDLLGGKAAFPNGINMDLFRLRLAFGRLDWQNFSLEAGQDWSIFAPLNPTSFAEYAIPSMSASGNPWIRMPQFRAELHSDSAAPTRFQLQLAAIDPNMGDYPVTAFSSGRTPEIGERGRAPGAEARLAVSTKREDRDLSIGLSSHYARGKNAGMTGAVNVQRGVDSWGVALDYSLPLTRKFAISGEAFEGRALGIFSVNAGEAILPVGTVGEHGVEARGGWAQAQFNATAKWQVNLVYGIELANPSQLRTGDRSKNQSYMGNLVFKLSPSVTFAWEWRRILTDFRNQRSANEKGDIGNMGVAYTF
jgi:hypothetical protein